MQLRFFPAREKPGRFKDDIHAQARMKQMHDLIELMTGWLADVQKMDSSTLVSLMKMGAKVQKLLEAGSKVKAGFSGRALAKPETEPPATLSDKNRS